MKKIKKQCLLLAALLTVGSTLSVGCSGGIGRGGSGGEYEETVDNARTQLYVSNYDGGVGTDWLRDVKARFEEDYADYEGENGKVGVQIMIATHKNKATSMTPKNETAEVFFGEEVPYQTWAATGQLLNVSDVMADILAQENVGITETYANALTKINDAYYGIPHYETYSGIVYNKRIFSDRRFYKAKDGSWTNASGDLTLGMDGLPETDDDGLPTTMMEFLELVEHMRLTVTPFIVTGKYAADGYGNNLTESILGSYGGEALLEAMATGKGKNIEVIDSVTEDATAPFGYRLTTHIEPEIDQDNAYLLWETPARFYGLCMFKEIVKTSDLAFANFEDGSLTGSHSHTEAQALFLESERKTPIAMMFEGNWWENEATAAFTNAEKYGSKFSKKNQQFGWMPLPSKVDADDDNAVENASFDAFSVFAFIRSNISSGKVDLAKDFLRYCYSEEELDAFTAKTGIARSLSYKISDASYDGLSEFSKQIWNYHNNATIVHKMSDEELVMYNEDIFFTYKWQSVVSGKTYKLPWDALQGSMSVLSYYNGMSQENNWSKVLNNIVKG